MITGQVRRFFRRGPLKPEMELAGECRNCGACCRLTGCRFLKELPDGTTQCRIHRLRPYNCRVFPRTAKDLADRSTVAPDSTCGFYPKKRQFDSL